MRRLKKRLIKIQNTNSDTKMNIVNEYISDDDDDNSQVSENEENLPEQLTDIQGQEPPILLEQMDRIWDQATTMSQDLVLTNRRY
jgi:hypothetical protein